MLSECSSRLNEIGVGSRKIDPTSPYLIQFKVFEDRLKKQGNPARSQSKGNALKEKMNDSSTKNDYMKIVKSFL